jgi:hypothetical protein
MADSIQDKQDKGYETPVTGEYVQQTLEEGQYVLYNGKSYQVKRSGYVPASGTSNPGTETQIVAAVAGKKITVLQYTLVNNLATTMTFRNGAGGTALEGFSFAANTPMIAPFVKAGHFQTTAGVALVLNNNSGTGGNCTGGTRLLYIEAD